MLRLVLLFCYISSTILTESPCLIELECAECLPDYMPLVTSHRAVNATVTAASGDEVVLSCRGGKFLAYPLLESLTTMCEGGRYRVRHDGTLRHLFELGCQEDIFEDVLHHVEFCEPPLQGRAYRVAAGRGARHLATLCFDLDRALPLRARASSAALALPPHAERAAPRSLLGNFNHMFDGATRAAARALHSDLLATNRRLRELLRHDRFAFADQTLASAELLAAQYFDDQSMRVAHFVSNRVLAWRSVVAGNLRHLHHDVAKFMKLTRPHTVLDIYAGTHGVLELRTGHEKTKIFLKPERFPVPRYVWTVVHDRNNSRALAVLVLNDPFVAISEVREAVFCESACARVGWLHELRRQRRYETPLYGLAFCCAVHELPGRVPELPARVLADVPPGSAGMLTDFLI